MLAKNLGATLVAVFTLALAIGATTAIFSVVYGVLLRPLPFPAPDRLMAIWEVNHRGTFSRLADPNFDDFRDRNHTFNAMSWVVGQRTTEFGIRMALGARARDVVTMLMTQSFKPIAIGIVLGVLGGFGLSRALNAMRWRCSAPICRRCTAFRPFPTR